MIIIIIIIIFCRASAYNSGTDIHSCACDCCIATEPFSCICAWSMVIPAACSKRMRYGVHACDAAMSFIF
jgi:hypothetical protein